MTQFQTIAANTLNAVNQHPLQAKRKQTQDRLANPANRTSLRDRRNLALINQGIDPDELRKETRLMRTAFKRGMIQNREMFREAKRNNDPALRQQAEQDRLRLEEERLNLNDRFKLTRSSPRDLPAEEQMRRRADSRAQLQAQLPTIAATARAQETQAAAENTSRLARIGREAYKLELGTTPPQNISDEALAEFARSASPEVVDRVTKGVGLPQAPQTGNADRLARLAQTGVDFPDFAPSARQDNPAVVDRIRTSQAQDRLDRQAALAIAGNQRDGAVVGSEVGVATQRADLNEQQQRPSLLASQQERLALENRGLDTANRTSNAELALNQKRAELEGAQIDEELNKLNRDTTPSNTGSAAMRAGLPAETPQQMEDANAYLNQVPDMVRQIAGEPSNEQSMKAIDFVVSRINELDLRADYSPEQKTIIAQDILDQLDALADSGLLVRDSLGDPTGFAMLRFARKLVTGRGDEQFGSIGKDTIRINNLYRNAIKKLKSMAGKSGTSNAAASNSPTLDQHEQRLAR